MTGEAYALVWADPGTDDGLKVTVEHPATTIVEFDPSDHRVRRAALKAWADDGVDYAIVYLPDSVHWYERQGKGPWQGRSVGPNPLGVVPVVPLVNRPQLMPYEGRSEIADVTAIQDRINATIFNRLLAAEFTAFRQRWVTGIEIPTDPETGAPVEPFKHAVNRLWISEDPETKFGEFGETGLGPYIGAVEADVQHIAAITRTPPHYLLGQSGAFPSGEPVAVSEPVLTANRGWSTMGDIVAGDEVYGRDGLPAAVAAVHDIHEGRPCFRVVFDDGAEVVTDGGHRWPAIELAHLRRAPVERIATTSEIRASLRHPGHGTGRNHNGLGRPRWRVAVAAPLDRPDADLPVDPWLLGYWLANGVKSGAQLTCHVDDADWVQARVENAGHEVHRNDRRETRSSLLSIRGMRPSLRAAGLLGNKRVPDVYVAASMKQRLALVQGFLDGDGHATKDGRASIDLNHQQLANDLHGLLLTLGEKVTIRQRPASSTTPDGRRYRYDRWRLCWTPSLPVFSMPRKAERVVVRDDGKARVRYIVDVVEVESVPVRCITVDNADHVFLVGRSLIPTCNSLKSTETGLVAKVKRRQQHFGEAWEEVIRLAFAVVGDPRSKADDAETLWADPESRTEGEHVDALLKLSALGVPQQQLWEDAGYSPQQIARFRTMAAEDSLRVLLTQPRNTASPQSAEVVPPVEQPSSPFIGG